MATLTPLQKRAARKARNHTGLDMNLVSLIDVFTILIFFLLSNAGELELLPPTKAVQLPESTVEQAPQDTLVVVVSAEDIVVDGRTVAKVAQVLAAPEDLIAPLKDELALQLQRRPVVRAENAEQAQVITIMGDKDIPYQLLRKVMVSAARAGFADVRFAVRQKASST
jgi:biopolymer transport protein TolR